MFRFFAVRPCAVLVGCFVLLQCAAAFAQRDVDTLTPPEIDNITPPAVAPPTEEDFAADTESIDDLVLKVILDTANRAMARGAFEQAEAQYRRALERNPDVEGATAGLAASLMRQGRAGEAQELLESYAEMHPNDARVPLLLGRMHLAEQRNCTAIDWLGQARYLDPDLPDVDYYLGSAILQAEQPLCAYRTLLCGKTSSREIGWAQDLAIGASLAQLGLQCEASGYFDSVRQEAGDTALGQQALSLQEQLDESVFCSPRLRGSLKATARYDNNPGIVPTADIFGAPLLQEPSAGHLYYGQFDYDLVRTYNYTLSTGYALLGTANYDASRFDLLDNAVYLAAYRRTMWRDTPMNWGLRADYDDLRVGGDGFLSRTALTPTWTVQSSDLAATTMLFRWTNYDFYNQIVPAGTPFDQNSDDFALGIFRQQEMLRRDITWSYGYQYNRNRSDGDNFDYRGHRFLLGALWKLPRCWELGVSNWFYLRDYDNPHSLFGFPRHDKQYTMQIALRYPLREQLYLSFEYLLDRNDSNLIINDYDRQLFEVALEYRFPYSNRRR